MTLEYLIVIVNNTMNALRDTRYYPYKYFVLISELGLR